MTADKPRKKMGRPVGSKAKTFSAKYSHEVQIRAHQIYRESMCLANDAAVSKQLLEEGYEAVDPQTIGRWRRIREWDETPVKTPLTAESSEELRQAVRVRVPDDLNRVEQASVELANVTTMIAQRVAAELPKIKIETPADLEIVTRCMRELLHANLNVGKGLQDLRLLRVSSNFGPDDPRDGEIIPPDRRQQNDPPPGVLSRQAEVISNFAEAS